MSLVNDLLINLEERRGGNTDQQPVFSDLSPAIGYEYFETHSTAWWKLVLITVVAFSILVIWFNFQSNKVISTPEPVFPGSASDEQTQVPVAVDESGTVINASESKPVENNASPTMVDVMLSLKLDDLLSQVPAATTTARTTEPEPSIEVVPELHIASDINKVKPVVKAVHIDGDSQYLQLQLELGGEPAFHSYILDKPDRLVIELENTDYEITTLDWSASPHINKIRTGQHDDKLRMVFDLNKSFVLEDSKLLAGLDSSQLLISLVDPLAKPSQPEVVATESYDQTSDHSVIENRYMEVKPRNKITGVAEKEDDHYQIGLLHYQQRRFDESASALLQAVQQNPVHSKAQYFLALALLYAGKPNEAEAQLGSALSYLPDNTELKRLYAHILMDQGKSLDALAVLADSPPAIDSDIDYHALLAALLQDQQMHNEAADIYKNLVRLRPENGIWWMGLGISLEALSLHKEALNAYRQAMNIGTLPANLSKYVSSRIQTLGRERS